MSVGNGRSQEDMLRIILLNLIRRMEYMRGVEHTREVVDAISGRGNVFPCQVLVASI